MLMTIRSHKLWRLLILFLLFSLIGLGAWKGFPYALAEYHGRHAEQSLRLQRYASALAELNQALRFRPDSASLHLLAGRVARQAGEFTEAREHLRKCRQLQKGVSEERQLEEYMLRAQSGELEQVQPFLVPYLYEEGPQTPLVLETLVRAYLSQHRSDRAGQCLTRWLQLQPRNVEALYLHGLLCAQQLNLEAANADYQRALELDPERVPIRLLLAENLKEYNMLDEAAGHYRRILQQEPHNHKARLGLAQCQVKMGHYDEARPLVEALCQEKEDSSELLMVRARLALQDDQAEQAEKLLRQAVARDPGYYEAHYQLMQCLQRRGAADEAKAESATLERIDRDRKRLIKIVTEKMKDTPNDPALHTELGEIYLRLGLTSRGIHWLHSALQLDPQYQPAHQCLARYHEGLGAEGKDRAAFHRRQLKASSLTQK